MNEFNNIYCFIKETSYEFHNFGSNQAIFKKLPEYIKRRIEYDHRQHIKFVQLFKELVTKLRLDIQFFKIDERFSIKPEKNDLIMSCGGDGTFLTCAQSFSQSTLLGMNSNCALAEHTGSTGALTCININNIEKALTDLKNNEITIKKWQRLCAQLNDTIIDNFAINEIYFGNATAYLTTDITLEIDGAEAHYLCSGIICCTGMGSHAWFHAAGGNPFSNELNAFGYKVLLPIKKSQFKYDSSILSDSHKLIIKPNKENYVISFDSHPAEIYTNIGDQIIIYLDNQAPINVITFN